MDKRAIKKHKEFLLAKRGVVAVGVGKETKGGVSTGKTALICSVVKKKPIAKMAATDVVLKKLGDGVLTDVVESGRITFQSNTGRHRPAPGGVSVGHYTITAGTLGCYVEDTAGGMPYILSNNHVLANVNKGTEGDAILQPGAHDGGEVGKDTIADLIRFVHITPSGSKPDCGVAIATSWLPNLIAKFLGSQVKLIPVYAEEPVNKVDCAIAAMINRHDVSNEIIGIGRIIGAIRLSLGDKVQKSGRTTSVTYGEVVQTDVAANIDMGNGMVARFEDQLLMGAMSGPGDSGSAILDLKKRIGGLLFAGSDKVTIANRIENVFAALGVHLYTG